MAEFIVTINNNDLVESLKRRAKSKGISVKELLSQILEQQAVDDISKPETDPLVGALDEFESDEDDVSLRADDIIHDEWKP
jgi:hypothetical protein